jgi:hypothetical protein
VSRVTRVARFRVARHARGALQPAGGAELGGAVVGGAVAGGAVIAGVGGGNDIGGTIGNGRAGTSTQRP